MSEPTAISADHSGQARAAADERVSRFIAGAPIFYQPWWLDAVSPGARDYVVAMRGEEVAGVLPYVSKVRLNRFRLIEMPKLTPYLGPWLRPSTGKYANRLGEEKDLMTELIAGLPKFATFQQDFHPSVTNWLPFRWQNFEQTTLYTYLLEDTRDPAQLWSETRDNIRTDVRKARKSVKVEEGTLEDFLPVHRLTFSRQGKEMPHSEDLLRRVDHACSARQVRRILIARGEDGRCHAGIYLVTDAETVYYLLGGGDPELRNSGATSLLIWNAIEWAASLGKQFDFEGSVVEPIERFVRSFGARQVPYHSVRKTPSRVVSFYRAFVQLARR